MRLAESMVRKKRWKANGSVRRYVRGLNTSMSDSHRCLLLNTVQAANFRIWFCSSDLPELRSRQDSWLNTAHFLDFVSSSFWSAQFTWGRRTQLVKCVLQISSLVCKGNTLAVCLMTSTQMGCLMESVGKRLLRRNCTISWLSSTRLPTAREGGH